MGSIGGQASGDMRLSNSALRILYSLVKDTVCSLASDGFTQSNPSCVTAAANVSTTLPATVKKGVLGGSVAFLRPDVTAGNTVGGAVKDGGGNYIVDTRPVGLFINDAVGNAYENTPAVASGKNTHLRGGSVGVKIYETQIQVGANTDLTYSVGQRLYASVNGLLTNRWQDSYEFQWIDGVSGSGAASACLESDVTYMGVVLSPPDGTSTELFCALSF